MYAIFIRSDYVAGFLDRSKNDEELFIEHVLVEEVPESVIIVPEGYLCKYDSETETFYHEKIPEPPKTPEQVKIEQLESDNLTLMEAVADLYEMILLGGAV